MKTSLRIIISSTLLGGALVTMGQDVASQEPGVVTVVARETRDLNALRQWDETLDGMVRNGDLVVTSRLGDASIEGRTHEYLAQHYAGIPVLGGGVSRQLDGSGVTVSLFGTLYPGITLDSTPRRTGPEIATALERMHGGAVVAGPEPRLGILPTPFGSYALAYRVAMSDGYFYYADAADGALLRRRHAFRPQSAIGVGATFEGHRRKLSTTHAEGRYEAHDRLRPGEHVTLDLRYDLRHRRRLLADHFFNGLPPGEAIWTPDDIAADMDNDWDDPAVVGAHAYAGWFYDYFAKRHGWEGVDGSNMRSILMVNDEIANAFFWYPPFGPEGTGAFSFGNYMGEPFTWLDIVGHELMHAVTHFSVSERTGNPDGLFNVAFPIGWRLGPKGFTTRGGTTYTCSTARFPGWVVTPDGRLEEGLVQALCIDGRFVLGYAGAGAIHESYSDIFGESLGFFYRDQGVSADYEYLGDAEFGPVRFLNDPKQRMDPDHYRDRYEFAVTVSGGYWDYSEFAFIDGRFVGSTGEHSYGGDHWNSLILSHAYYLAVEGGTHGSSGVVVDGVGDSNRAEMERIFFRAMRDLMPSMATLPMAAAIIRQSAADLAPGSAAERAIDQALRAVGLSPGLSEQLRPPWESLGSP